MRRGDLLDDWHHTARTLLAGVVVIVLLGVALGAVAGVALTTLFDASGIDEFGRNFSQPGAVEEVG